MNPTAADVPLLDDLAPCAGCWNEYPTWRLCSCDEDPGPCCDDGCHDHWHVERDAA